MDGLRWKEIREVAETLGFKAKLVRKYDLHEATGILGVSKKAYDHAVYLWHGRVIEPGDQAMWLDPEEYLQCMKLKAGSLLVLEG